MNEMVARVAEALWHERVARLQIPYRDHATESDKLWCRNAARAAIAAMREPTEAMCDAGVYQADVGERGDESGDVWRAMIDAALAD